MSDERTEADESSRQAESVDSTAPHDAGDPPTTDEEEAAERARRDPALSGDQEDVAGHYREMTERGAHQQGEGKI